jgi:general transcription factor 3C polypeptide 3 (transcription factor C subunit 4)
MSFKKFYPLDKYIKFLGYSGGSRLEAETPLDQDLTAMAERLSRGLSTQFQSVGY